ncbi:hypothetical protein EYC87_17630 [Halieaceae bacterium IMCC8485]|uniref:Uncharacterized protein n=1 Tax=Candidatus Seongchinamella marina TaxID=2518990 RepID=A0ABT3SZR5_9GAMM|nr:hypothetical protein [Candidatus Seongchinamella marina]MCX2975405.1 hypothetical protein [Candidatus Seongchinamella marina]
MARSSKTPLPGAMDEALEIFVGDPGGANIGGGGQDDKEKEKTYTFSHLSFHDALYEQRCWRDLNGVEDHPSWSSAKSLIIWRPNSWHQSQQISYRNLGPLPRQVSSTANKYRECDDKSC